MSRACEGKGVQGQQPGEDDIASSSAISSAVKLSRSGIKSELVALLKEREANFQDTTISWVRAHIGIPGNEKADRLAAFASALSPVRTQLLQKGESDRPRKP
ncbi:hypothetical protein BGX38DRAFT_1332734 [Terfezia claveryi]|nr:hypothetical protein BGX38DRAFT_1332734 [Terfezia claveryi]